MGNLGSPLTDLVGGLTQPITKLLDMVSSVFGKAYEPVHTKRMAKAEAEAGVIRTEGEIREQELLYRANIRIENQKLRRQKNLEAIVAETARQLPNAVSEEPVDEDWVFQFFNYSQDVSNEEMQLIWARLLAGEIEKPGSFSHRTLQLVRVLSQSDAVMFRKFCSYIWGNVVHFHSPKTKMLLDGRGFKTMNFMLLEELGLISYKQDLGFPLPVGETVKFDYFDRSMSLTKNGQAPGLLTYPLTNIGRELAMITDATPDYDYFELLISDWRQQGCDIQVS
jgi:hypothetical protein